MTLKAIEAHKDKPIKVIEVCLIEASMKTKDIQRYTNQVNTVKGNHTRVHRDQENTLSITKR